MGKNIKLNKNRILVGIMFGTFALISWAPATGNSTLGTESFRAITRVVYFIAAFLIALFTKWKKKLPFIDLLIALTPVIYLCFQKLYSYGDLKGSTSAMLLCSLFALQSDETRKNVYKVIRSFLFFMALVGIICFLLFICNIDFLYEIVPYYSKTVDNQWYINYGISYLYHNNVQTRLCGLFNEPGWFGTFLALYLCAEKLDFSKVQNIIIGIGGILTFSLAFVLIVAIYYVIKQIDDWKKWIGLLLFLCFYIFILPNIQTGNDGIDRLIRRMEVTEEGISGDNRTTDRFDAKFEEMMGDKSILLGKGYGYHLTIGAGSACSIKTYIMDFGFIGTIILFLPVLLLLAYRHRKNKDVLLFLICVAASLYQRPWLFETSNFFLVLSAVSYIASIDLMKVHENCVIV